MPIQKLSTDETLLDTTAFQRDLLVTLAINDALHGLAVKEALEPTYGREIGHGRLYPNLDQLADAGLVDKGQMDLRTNSYELTADGRAAVESDWLCRNPYGIDPGRLATVLAREFSEVTEFSALGVDTARGGEVPSDD